MVRNKGDAEETPKGDEEGDAGDTDSGEDEPETLRESLILLARDVAIAVLIVAVVLAGIFAYTRVWPPNVVVESGSMEHNDAQSEVGPIDTGDIVLVQSAPNLADVVTWVDGKAAGHRTYGEFGDVIVFHPPGSSPGATPIIHRPIIYLVYNASGGGGYDAPSLLALNPIYWTATSPAGPFPFNMNSLTLRTLGFRGDLEKTWNFQTWPSRGDPDVSGYLTMGDHNAYTQGDDGWIVPHPLVIGKARGEFPWFGLLKLLVQPSPGNCCAFWGDTREAAKNSWDSLAVSLVLLIASPFLVDFAYTFVAKRWKHVRRWWRRVRGSEKADEDAVSSGEPAPDSPDDAR